MRRALTIVAAAALSIAALAVGLAAAAIALIDGETARPFVESALSRAFGRETRIGALTVDKRLTPRFEMTDVTVSGGSDAAPLARLGRVEGAVALASVFGPRWRFPQIAAADGTVSVVRDAEGRWNWGDVPEAAADIAPKERRRIPEIDALRLSEIAVAYDDQRQRLRGDMTVASVEGIANAAEGVALEAAGTFEGESWTLRVAGDDFDALVDGAAPYPLALTLDGPARATLAGEVAPEDPLRRSTLALKITGDSLGRLAGWTGLPLPPTPPFTLSADIAVDGEAYGLTDLEATLGESDASGEIMVSKPGETIRIDGALRSAELRLADLGVGSGGGPALDVSIPTLPDGLSVDFDYAADRVVAPRARIVSFEATATLKNGRLALDPLKAGLAEGAVEGSAALANGDDAASATLELRYSGVALQPFLEGSRFAAETSGALEGAAFFEGVGATAREMLKAGAGRGHAVMRDGSVSGLMVEAAGLDLVEALGLLIGGDARVPVRCAALGLDLAQGVAEIREGALSTRDSLIALRGSVDAAAMTVDLRVEGRAHDFSLLDAAAPVAVTGPLADPEISIGGVEPLAFFERGDVERARCDALISAAREAG